MSLLTTRVAPTEHPVLDVLAERWSTRIFDPATPIDEDRLESALEAARWAPSAANTQPWRAIVARRGTETHAKVFASLLGFNQAWAGDAGALVVFLADTRAADGSPQRWAVYDTGQAAAFFTVQAHANGLSTHQMGGFDAAALRAGFALPEHIEPLAIMAVGAFGDPAAASEQILERENAPRLRKPLAESVLIDD